LARERRWRCLTTGDGEYVFLCLFLLVAFYNDDSISNIANNIIAFLSTGKQIYVAKVPAISKAKPNTTYPIHKNALMLKGNFKNTGKHKEFLKQLIGNNYKTKVAGIDWLNKRWLQGNPPTYAQFAEFYKTIANQPLQEKASLRLNNFTKNYAKQNPNASMQQITQKWEEVRLHHKQITLNLVNKYKHTVQNLLF